MTIAHVPQKRPFWRWIPSLVLFAVATGAIAFIAGLFSLSILFSEGLPAFRTVDEYKPRIITRFYSVDDQLIGEFSIERRVLLPFNRIPKTFIQAFMASEDAGFFEHQGIDYLGLVRSAFKTMTSKGQQGGSTISMQVAKAMLSDDVRKGAKSKSLWQKIRYKGTQIVLAQRLESNLAKEDILYLYLNQIYLGHGSYGVQAAAENYFRKNVWELTISEQALIAGLPQAPSRFSPFTHPERARERQKYVLRRMLEEQYITQAELDAALKEPLVVHPLEDAFRDMAPHFVETVRRYVADKYGDKALYEDGLDVYTTLDLERNAAAQKAVSDGLHDLDRRQGFRGALLSLEAAQFEAFKDKYQKTLPEGALPTDRALVALVTETSKDRALISVGKTKAQIPLASLRWARKPNPLVYYEYQLQDAVDKVLKKGDVVLVRPTSKEQLAKEKSAAVALPKITDDLPLFALDQEPIAESALLSANPHTGYVHAMIGGYNFDNSELNRTLQSCRQPGSSFKPIVYAAAFDKAGFTPATILQDTPIVFDDPTNQVRWKPENSHGDFKGDVTVRTAIQQSLNIPAVKTLEKVGIEATLEYAKRLGITNKLNRDFSIALGASCVTLWDLSTVYGAFDALGLKPRYGLIRRIVDRDGKVLESRGAIDDPTQTLRDKIETVRRSVFQPRELVLDPVTSFIVVRQLTNVVNGGTGFYASRVGKNVAGKTGTTNDQFDAWFMGFSRDMVTGVWVGHDKNERPLGAMEFGGRAALPIWTDYMSAALKGVDQPPLEAPPGVVMVRMDPDTGTLASEKSQRSVPEFFRKDTEPKRSNEDNKSDEFYKIDSNL